MAAGRHLKKHINRRNSAAIQDISTKFGMQIDTGQLRLPLTSNFTLTKFKMAAAAILKIYFMAITQSLLHVFTQNLAQREKPTSWEHKYLQISLLCKSKMAVNRHFENT